MNDELKPYTVVTTSVRSYLVYATSADEAREAWVNGLSGDEGVEVSVQVDDVFLSEPDEEDVS